jgi:divalent metal cation (Fe/Co/Zn/Cd) transporter
MQDYIFSILSLIGVGMILTSAWMLTPVLGFLVSGLACLMLARGVSTTNEDG